MTSFPERLKALRKQLGLTQKEMAARMGLSLSYIHQMEKGKKDAGDAVVSLVSILEHQSTLPDRRTESTLERNSVLKDDPLAGFNRRIHVVGWAHAGEAQSYEEMPYSWREDIPTDCRDPHAFAVRLEGDSMEPKFSDGDLLVLQPSQQPYSGCFVVCRFKNDGVIFRRMEIIGEVIRLTPVNERYTPTEHKCDEFLWVYPLWGRWTQFWKA